MAVEENKTPRAVLSYFWSVFSAFLLGYIVMRWGDKMEILTLIIGLIGGTILGGIFSVYFVTTHRAQSTETQKTTTEITDEGTTITQEPIKDETKTN